MFGRSWVRFLSGTQIFFFFLSHARIMLNNSSFTFYYRAQHSPSVSTYQKNLCNHVNSDQSLQHIALLFFPKAVNYMFNATRAINIFNMNSLNIYKRNQEAILQLNCCAESRTRTNLNAWFG